MNFLDPADVVVAARRETGAAAGGPGMLRAAVMRRQLSEERRAQERRMEEIHLEHAAAAAAEKKERARARELPGFDKGAPALQLRLSLIVERHAASDEIDEIAGAVGALLSRTVGAGGAGAKLEMRVRANRSATASELYAFVDSVLAAHGPVIPYVERLSALCLRFVCSLSLVVSASCLPGALVRRWDNLPLAQLRAPLAASCNGSLPTCRLPSLRLSARPS